MPLEVFTQRNFVADLLSTEVEFYWQNHVLWHPLGDLGVTYTVPVYGSLESAQISGGKGDFGVRKLDSLGYHVTRGVVCVILRLAVLIQSGVTQTDRCTMMTNIRAALAPRGLNQCFTYFIHNSG